jgi:hypothetical protein
MAISKWYLDSSSLENTVAVLLYSLEQLHTDPKHRVLPLSAAERITAAAVTVPFPSCSWLWHSISSSPAFTFSRFFGQMMVRKVQVQIK